MHATVFKKLGHKLYVLEKSSQDVLRSQAAGLQAGQVVQKFTDEYIKYDKAYATVPAANIIEVVNSEGAVINPIPVGNIMHLITWNSLFELFKSHLLNDSTSLGASYETDKLGQDVVYNGGKVSVSYMDTKNIFMSILKADLLIAADGGHSTVRKMILSEITLKYVGYVTWRGSVSENCLTDALRAVWQDRVLLFRTEKGFAVS